MITRDNYEIYFIDYLDGKLSPSERQEMQTFLLINNDLQELLEDTKQVKLSPPDIRFKGKQALKKEAYHECPDYYAIATAENTLTDDDKNVIHHRNKDKDFQSLVKIYRQLKLKPDPEIRFTHKKQLYRKDKRIFIVLSLSGVAATILLILALAIPLFQTNTPKTSFARPEDVQISSSKLENTLESEHISTEIEKRTEKAIIETIPQTREIKTRERLAIAQIFIQKQIEPVYDRLAAPENIRIIDTVPFPIEIILTKNAETWKPSGSNSQSKNLITEMINAGKNLAELLNGK